MFVPNRSIRPELLDLQPAASAELGRNLREMAMLYRGSGGLRLGWRALERVVGSARVPLTLLDVAAGDGTIATALVRRAAQIGVALRPLISDVQRNVVQIAAHHHAEKPVLAADALHLPFGSGSVDVVHCSQAVHHFAPAEAANLLRECARVARCGVVVVDLRRSWLGYWGARTLALGPLTALGRHDGPLSVLRAYTPAEAHEFAAAAGLKGAQIMVTPIYWALVWRKSATN